MLKSPLAALFLFGSSAPAPPAMPTQLRLAAIESRSLLPATARPRTGSGDEASLVQLASVEFTSPSPEQTSDLTPATTTGCRMNVFILECDEAHMEAAEPLIPRVEPAVLQPVHSAMQPSALDASSIMTLAPPQPDPIFAELRLDAPEPAADPHGLEVAVTRVDAVIAAPPEGYLTPVPIQAQPGVSVQDGLAAPLVWAGVDSVALEALPSELIAAVDPIQVQDSAVRLEPVLIATPVDIRPTALTADFGEPVIGQDQPVAEPVLAATMMESSALAVFKAPEMIPASTQGAAPIVLLAPLSPALSGTDDPQPASTSGSASFAQPAVRSELSRLQAIPVSAELDGAIPRSTTASLGMADTIPVEAQLADPAAPEPVLVAEALETASQMHYSEPARLLASIQEPGSVQQLAPIDLETWPNDAIDQAQTPPDRVESLVAVTLVSVQATDEPHLEPAGPLVADGLQRLDWMRMVENFGPEAAEVASDTVVPCLEVCVASVPVQIAVANSYYTVDTQHFDSGVLAADGSDTLRFRLVNDHAANIRLDLQMPIDEAHAVEVALDASAPRPSMVASLDRQPEALSQPSTLDLDEVGPRTLTGLTSPVVGAVKLVSPNVTLELPESPPILVAWSEPIRVEFVEPTSATPPTESVIERDAGPVAMAMMALTPVPADPPPPPQPADADAAPISTTPVQLAEAAPQSIGDPNDTIADETLGSAILAAISNNPDILNAQARRDDAKFGVNQSRAALYPTLDISAGHGLEVTSTGKNSPVTAQRSEAQVLLRQLLWDFGAAGSDVKRAKLVYRSTDLALRSQVDSVAFEVASAYLQVLERQQLVALAKENIAAHEKILKTVNSQKEFGLVSGADISRVEAKLNAARGAVLDRQSDLAQAREGFRRQLDRLPGTLAPAPLAEPLIPSDSEETLGLAEAGNPELLQAKALLESVQKQKWAQQASYMPTLTLEAERNWKNNVAGRTGQADDARAMVTLRYRLFDGGSRSALINRIDARIRQAQSDLDKSRRDLQQVVRNDYAALSAARDKVSAIDSEVEAGQRLVELYEQQFRSGGRSVFDVLDSQETLITAKAKRISNVTAREISAYRVLKATGDLFKTATGDIYRETLESERSGGS